MESVAEELVGGGGLLDDGFEGGMRVERGHDGGPTVVGGSGDAGAAVVVGDVFDEPVDGVPGVGGFVDAFRILGIVRRAAHHKFAFGFEPATDILRDDVVALPAGARGGGHDAIGGFFGGGVG